MKTIPAVTALLAASAVAQPQAQVAGQGVELVRITDGGEFVEVERMAEFSTVEVRRAPAGSVPASLFALRGACAVARARGEQYFASVPVPGPVATHRLSFPRSPTKEDLSGPKKSVFALADCEMLKF